MAEGIPPEVERFVQSTIHSVEQLEVLLLLFRTASQHWSAHSVAKELRRAPTSIAGWLENLRARGLVEIVDETGETYRFAPRDRETESLVRALADTYDTYHVSLISMIYAKPRDSIRRFADAFRIRKEDEDG